MLFSALLALGATSLVATAAQVPVMAAAPAAASGGDTLTTVTITRVATPWYGFRWLVKRGFRRAVPEYEAIEGLQQKNFALTPDGRFFGGVYLWRDEAAARAWFTPAWFDRVRATYGVCGEVTYYTVEERRTFARPASLTGGYYTVLAFGAVAPVAATPGLLRLTTLRAAGPGRAGTLTLWTTRAAAEAHFGPVGSRPGVEFFDTPVLIDK